MRQTGNTPLATPPATLANTVATATPASFAPPARKKAIKPVSIKAVLARPTNPLMEQFVRDMAVAGHCDGTQATYLGAVQQFIIATWTSPEQATEVQLQNYLIALRERDVAGETFRVQRFALQFLFQNTLARDWPLFKKN